jgi:hypothetical protein
MLSIHRYMDHRCCVDDANAGSAFLWPQKSGAFRKNFACTHNAGCAGIQIHDILKAVQLMFAFNEFG